MKLPADGMKPADTTSDFENFRERDTNGGTEPAPGINDNPVNGFRGEAPAHFGSSNFSGVEPDFSEFLWMENEEEYDRQVLHELEEEEIINYYFDLYQDSLQAEANGQQFPYAHILGAPGLTNNGATPPTNQSMTTSGSSFNGCSIQSSSVHFPTGRRNSGEDLSASLDRVLTFQSSLNPDAPEFVPRNFSSSQDKPTPPPSS